MTKYKYRVTKGSHMKWWPIILLLLVLVSCQGQQRPEGADKALPIADFRTGGQGLVMNFAPNLPPTTLYETEGFNTIIELENRGASNLEVGNKIYLSGFDPRIITGIPRDGISIPTIEGKNQYNLQGGFDQVAFSGTIARLQGDTYPTPVMATACYHYETIAAETVCIDSDPFGPRLESKVCTPTNVGAGTQGAPISVNNIEVDARPGKTIFRIRISNVGGGDVFRKNVIQKCNPSSAAKLGFEDIDYVELTSVEVGGLSITPTCKPLDTNHIPLRNGQGVVTCEMPTTGSSAYVTPIIIKLRYGYRDVIRRDTTIYRVN
jgi:hypothetical protein